MRSTLITVMFSGYSVGGIVAALVGRGLIESYGWQGVFLAAAAPAVLLPWIWRQMPESMAFLHKRGRTSELQAILARTAPQYAPQADDVFVVASGTSRRRRRCTLFAEGRGFSTVMFWVTCFMSLFMVYALNAGWSS